jgi:hypothetical protein
MSVDPQKVALYLQGTFSTANPTQQQLDVMLAAAQDISGSGFGTAILGQWHVHPDGSIYYNDSLLDTVTQALSIIPPALKASSGSVQKVLITFGPFGSDFQAIKDNLDQFKQTMGQVATSNGIDGFDWDLEGDYEQFTDLLVDLTQWANGLGLMVTAAPYTDNSFWTNVLEQTNKTGSSAGFSWWNLQLYGGADYSAWVGYLDGLVSSPEAFLVPGYNIGGGMPPSDLTSQLSGLYTSYPSLDGGFIWRYEDIASSGYTTAQYAAAITSAFNSSTGGKAGS